MKNFVGQTVVGFLGGILATYVAVWLPPTTISTWFSQSWNSSLGLLESLKAPIEFPAWYVVCQALALFCLFFFESVRLYRLVAARTASADIVGGDVVQTGDVPVVILPPAVVLSVEERAIMDFLARNYGEIYSGSELYHALGIPLIRVDAALEKLRGKGLLIDHLYINASPQYELSARGREFVLDSAF